MESIVIKLYMSYKNLDVFASSKLLAMKILKKHNLLKSEIEFKEKDKFYTFLIDEYGYEDRTARTQENIKNMKMLEFINKEMTLKQMTKDKIEKEKNLKIFNLTNFQDKEEKK